MSILHTGQGQAAPTGESPANNLGVKLVAEFSEAETEKKKVEPRLLRCLRQYKGIYDPDVLKRIRKRRGRSEVYIRHTAAKVDSTKARLMDLLFPSNGALNWEIKPSPIPSVADETIALYIAEQQALGRELPTERDVLVREVAERSAELMTKKIADQLMEPSGNKAYPRVCDRVILSGQVFGTGILKGPMVSRSEQHRFKRVVSQQTGAATWIKAPVQVGDEYKPHFSAVSVWSFFPDPAAVDPADMMYAWEEHIMTRADFIALGKNPGFRPDLIAAHITANREGDAKLSQRQTELWSLKDSDEEGGPPTGGLKHRYRVLERWGYLNGEDLLEAGITEEDLALAFPDGFDPSGSYPACVWMTQDGKVIKAALAPIEGVALPYGFFQPYKDESSFWAEGLCDRIRDPQTAINAMARMTLDHASITTLPQIGINVSALANGEDPTDYSAGKVWMFDNGEDMASCMKMYELGSHIPEIMAIGEKFSQWSDETSTPRYMTGDNAGVRGAGDTASGLSMLMGAASLPSKDQVRQFDALTETFITNVYNWNMRFSTDERIKGDYDIIARGSTALIAQELQGRRTLEVVSILASPDMRGRTDWDSVLKHVLHFMSLPETLRLSPEQVRQREFEDAKMQRAAMIAAIMEEARKQGIPPQAVLQGLAGQAMQQQAPVQGQPMQGQRVPTPQEMPG